MSPRTDSQRAPQLGVCVSCGSPGEELVAVRRVYVTPEAWDTEERVEVVDEIERWCFPCRTHYPHQVVED